LLCLSRGVCCVRFLFIGDIVGRPGRKAVKDLLPALRQRHKADIVVANGENAAGGFGITAEVAKELFGAGIDLITMGNHTWDKKETAQLIAAEPRILRPFNSPPGTPGQGVGIVSSPAGRLGVVLVNGRVFMDPTDCPFRAADAAIASLQGKCDAIMVDVHAEATSEKVALGWHLDGRVAAVFGTHTHVQTADGRRLAGGTAYCTDVGMTGPRDSVIGMDKVAILRKFLTQMPQTFEVAKGDVRLCGAAVEVGYDGLCKDVEIIDEAAD
jgi:2',3'-cyclic-nucleotide 2'-phosphodiesterase